MPYSGNFSTILSGNQTANNWKVPCALTVGLHLFIIILSLLPPSFFYRRPELPEVITINLFNVEEQRPKKVVPKKRQAKKTPPPKVKEIPREKTPPPPPAEKPVASIVQEPPPPTSAAPHKLTSLSPRKIKKKTPPIKKVRKKVHEDKRLKALDRIQARVNKQKEDQKLKHDLAKLRESLHVAKASEEIAPPPATVTAPNSEPPETSEPSAPSTGSAELMDMALKRYYIAVSRRIHSHWVLPEMQNWDESLEALMVMVVRNDGTIIKNFFEKKSDNAYFNQFVEKTVKDSSPLPHFPGDIKERQLEIGLRFHPSGLY